MPSLIRVTCAAGLLRNADEDDIVQVDHIVHDDDTDDYNVGSYGIDADDTDDDVQMTCVYFVQQNHTQKDQIADVTLLIPTEQLSRILVHDQQ